MTIGRCLHMFFFIIVHVVVFSIHLMCTSTYDYSISLSDSIYVNKIKLLNQFQNNFRCFGVPIYMYLLQCSCQAPMGMGSNLEKSRLFLNDFVFVIA